ncbi:dihydrodipicolinate synthase family protein [uncultured Parolsenella sp.]|uniref:dihydrodipicolinate synthase family protein n=1 Tax=uncultured Parolsenella sp. TaxID=2083008 RepID=UPI00259A010E|nr:dihydrodipicolinate synthase family protein [uncultured Parolsenella sp.]
MRKSKFIVPAVTVFDEKGAVDLNANVKLWNELIGRGVDGILLHGSNGEFFALSEQERTELIEAAVEVARGKVDLIVGTGTNAVAETVRLSKRALKLGADAAMVITPFYFGLGHEGIVEYLCAVAGQVDGNVMLYNFPARTGNDIDADAVRQVVTRCPNVIGIKDTVTDMGHTRAIIEAVADIAPDFIVYSGFDENFAHNGLAGGSGCIAALANIYPELTHAWATALGASDWDRVEKIQHVIDELASVYDVAPLFVPAVKYAMSLRGLPVKPICRSTVLPLTEDQKEQIAAILETARQSIEANNLV